MSDHYECLGSFSANGVEGHKGKKLTKEEVSKIGPESLEWLITKKEKIRKLEEKAVKPSLNEGKEPKKVSKKTSSGSSKK